jgi:hypothetical protein
MKYLTGISFIYIYIYIYIYQKGKAIPLQAWTGPEDSRKLKLPDFKKKKKKKRVVSPMHRPPLPPGNIPGTHFC